MAINRHRALVALCELPRDGSFDQANMHKLVVQVWVGLRAQKKPNVLVQHDCPRLLGHALQDLPSRNRRGALPAPENQSAGVVSGGAITEVLSENGFCFYMALLVTNQIDKFDKKSFDGVKNKSDYSL